MRGPGTPDTASPDRAHPASGRSDRFRAAARGALRRAPADHGGPQTEGRGGEQLLFTAPQGGPLRARNFRQRFFAPAVVKAGLGHLKVTPHKLRHTAASLAIAGGADVNVVQTMLGHKPATLTLDTYGHLFPDRLDQVSKSG
ncbi:tyrosine-type recombinase/integrase [Streptomyces sp. NPDC052079]|uniref:tyrosine-type recombinase/integrase n=1 Tax=Streptomyces sp. NPDC052079 TaxID=3155526 RepID=UPI003422E6E8